jgi:hypothetical protein
MEIPYSLTKSVLAKIVLARFALNTSGFTEFVLRIDDFRGQLSDSFDGLLRSYLLRSYLLRSYFRNCFRDFSGMTVETVVAMARHGSVKYGHRANVPNAAGVWSRCFPVG